MSVPPLHATTVLAVRRGNRVVLAADGQVTMNDTVVKHSAKKLRRMYDDTVIAGFAGATADAFTLFERFEGKLKDYSGNVTRAAVEPRQHEGPTVGQAAEVQVLTVDRPEHVRPQHLRRGPRSHHPPRGEQHDGRGELATRRQRRPRREPRPPRYPSRGRRQPIVPARSRPAWAPRYLRSRPPPIRRVPRSECPGSTA